MRRPLETVDFDLPTLNVKVEGDRTEAAKTIAVGTEPYRPKDIGSQTLRATEHVATYVSPTLMTRELDGEVPGSPVRAPLEEPTEEDLKKLAKFLKRITPQLEKELEENFRQYENYCIEGSLSAFRRETRLVHTLENLDSLTEDVLEISDISWNSTGVTVAAAYSHYQHLGPCSHKAMLCVWSLSSRNFKPTKPNVVVTPNCINCIEFHPKRPSILICGSFIGEILLYDLSNTEECLIAKSSIDEYLHREVITSVQWWLGASKRSRRDGQYSVLSLSTDGKILVWEVNVADIGSPESKSRIVPLRNPIKGFLMLRRKKGEQIPVSGLSLCQSQVTSNTFIVGSEGGSVLRANLAPIEQVGQNAQNKALLDLSQQPSFKAPVYPFLVNLQAKNLREVKAYLQKVSKQMKIESIDSVQGLFQSRPQLKHLYPNPINFPYEPLAYPVSSLSSNRYGLFLANGCEGYSRIYVESERENLQCLEQGHGWAWLLSTSRLSGFVGQQWCIYDWVSGKLLWSMAVSEGYKWKCSNSYVGIVCEQTKIKVLELDERFQTDDENKRSAVAKKIQQLRQK